MDRIGKSLDWEFEGLVQFLVVGGGSELDKENNYAPRGLQGVLLLPLFTLSKGESLAFFCYNEYLSILVNYLIFPCGIQCNAICIEFQILIIWLRKHRDIGMVIMILNLRG